jgi:hypothetical protein
MSDLLNLVSLYKRRRNTSREMNHVLVTRLSRDVLDEGGKKLGILKGNKLILDTEDEIAVLMDFCIHDVRRNGRTAVESLARESPYAPGSEEMAYLNALLQARFSLLLIERVEPERGVEVRDLRWGGTKFIMDIGLSMSGSTQLLLGARIIPFESVFVTTGAALAAGHMPTTWKQSQWQRLLNDACGNATQQSPQEVSEWNAAMIRALLQTGAAERTSYLSPEENAASPQRATPLRQPTSSARRNGPCPCGSGKKFKKCCGARK